MRQDATPRMAAMLGYTGAAPFIGLGLYALSGPASGFAFTLNALAAYGAVILSFLGGIVWGRALRAAPERLEPMLFVSVVPSLAGWFALLAPPVVGFSLLLVGFAGMLAYDRRAAARGELPPWFARLRRHLSIAAMLGMAFGLLSAL